MYGMCVVDDFLGMTSGLSILNEGKLNRNDPRINEIEKQKLTSFALFSVHGLYAAGVFQVSVLDFIGSEMIGSLPATRHFHHSNFIFFFCLAQNRMVKLHRTQMPM